MFRFSKSHAVSCAPLILLGVFTCFAQTADANHGLHLGWCNRQNPHYDAVSCGGLGGTPTTVPGGTTNPTGGGSATSTPHPVVNTQPIIVTPLPPRVALTGHGVVQAITSTPGPDITGFGPAIVVQPLPQQTLTGVSPGAIQSIPSPSFSGYSPAINVNPIAVPSFTGLSPMTIIHPVLTPSFTGTSPMVTIVPVSTPSFSGFSPLVTLHPTPTPSFTGVRPPTPQQTVPTINATIAPVLVPRPRPTPNRLRPVATTTSGTSTHSATSSGSQNHGIITPTAGRQDVRNAPSVTNSSGDRTSCLTSGHGNRRSSDVSGASPSALRNANRIDSLARDIPARHPDEAHCLISIRTSSE